MCFILPVARVQKQRDTDSYRELQISEEKRGKRGMDKNQAPCSFVILLLPFIFCCRDEDGMK